MEESEFGLDDSQFGAPREFVLFGMVLQGFGEVSGGGVEGLAHEMHQFVTILHELGAIIWGRVGGEEGVDVLCRPREVKLLPESRLVRQGFEMESSSGLSAWWRGG